MSERVAEYDQTKIQLKLSFGAYSTSTINQSINQSYIAGLFQYILFIARSSWQIIETTQGQK